MPVNQLFRPLTRFLQITFLLALAVGTILVVEKALGGVPAHALPEFTSRTGEPCATCHVSAGGGGPRTMRGLLWAARGRPDDIPDLPGLLIAPGITDGGDLYETACAGCHGLDGEGLLGIDLANREISRAAIRTFIRRGVPGLEMPAFEGQFTEPQLEALTTYVYELGRGNVPPREYPLPAPEFRCEAIAGQACTDR